MAIAEVCSKHTLTESKEVLANIAQGLVTLPLDGGKVVSVSIVVRIARRGFALNLARSSIGTRTVMTYIKGIIDTGKESLR